MRQLFLGLVLAAGCLGCGPNVDDPGRTPAGAADTSDPMATMKGMKGPTNEAPSAAPTKP
jgi:hypothetical protein